MRRFAVIACLILTACAAAPTEHRVKREACPPVALDSQLQTLTHYDDGSANPFQNRPVSTARLTAFQNACTVDSRFLIVDMRLKLEGLRLDPSPRQTVEAFPYLLAVTNDRGRVLLERYYDAHLVFPANATQAELPQTLRETVPLEGRAPDALRIAVGFAVTQSRPRTKGHHP